MTEGVTSSLSAFEPRLPRPRRRRGNASTSVDSKGQPLSEKIAAEFSAAAEQGSPPSKDSKGSTDSKDSEGSKERLAEVGHAGPASRLAEAFSAAAEQGSPPSKSSKDSKDRLAEAVVVTRGGGRRRRSNSTLLERVLLSGGSVPPFANGRVVETVDQYVERVVNLEATAAAQNATTVPAGFGEPAAQDPDEWW